MGLINDLINSKILTKEDPPRDTWSLGTVSGTASGGKVPVIIDGETKTTNMRYCVPCANGDRVLTLLLGRTRLVTHVIDGPSAYAPASEGVTNGDSHDHADGDGGLIPWDGLKRFDSSSSSSGYSAYWTKLATAQIVSRYGYVEAHLDLHGLGGGYHRTCQVYFHVRQNDPLGNPPLFDLIVEPKTQYSCGTFIAVVTATTSELTQVELWWRPDYTWLTAAFTTPFVWESSGQSIEFHSDQSWEASLPSGTQLLGVHPRTHNIKYDQLDSSLAISSTNWATVYGNGLGYLSMGAVSAGDMVTGKGMLRCTGGNDYAGALSVYQGGSTLLKKFTMANAPNNASCPLNFSWEADTDYSDIRIYMQRVCSAANTAVGANGSEVYTWMEAEVIRA